VRLASLSRPVRIAAGVLLLASFVGGFLAARTLFRLDRIVVSRFEGRVFQVPSRVLSAPTILYPGLDWQHIDLRGALVRLGYRAVQGERALQPGRYLWKGQEIRIYLRAFDHPSRSEPARDIAIHAGGSKIDRIVDARSGRELGAVLLEPELVGSYYGLDREQRELVRIDDVPPFMIDAVIAVEDQRFRSHPGVDLRRILGALVVNLRSGGIRQGGSTLTQQLVKNFFLTPERSLRRKAQEAAMALIVEARYGKEEILESYLNEIYLGQRGATAIHGVGEASRFYFGKSARNLGVAESALLAAIIQSPNGISPYRSPEAAVARRNLVLSLMREQGRIDEREHELARSEPLRLAAITPEPREARYFLDALRRQLPEFYGEEALASEGMRIYSTLDLRLQKIAAASLREGLANLEQRHPSLVADDRSVQGCLIALRPQTGEVLALVGGRDYSESQFDRCVQARRPAGSIFKPFVFAAALEPSGGGPAVTLAQHLDDGPLSVETPTGTWQPANYEHEFHGDVTVREALERSLNVATARLGQEIGIQRVSEMARRLGISSPLPEVPSLAIGSADVAPIDVARAYATIANGGIRPEIRTFEDLVGEDGRALERQSLEFERVLDAGTAYLVTSLLEGVVDRGTARRVRAEGLTGAIAGKTGTSDDEHDAWLAGFTPELVVVVWVGFDEPRSLGIPASRAALPIWVDFVREVLGGHARGAFLPPPGVVRIDVDPVSGARALSGCPRREPEWFIRGVEPTEVCPRGSYADRNGEPRTRDPRGVIERLFDRWFQSQSL
jgi:penicillin-binding protein 1B